MCPMYIWLVPSRCAVSLSEGFAVLVQVSPAMLLYDNSHPQPWFLLQALNVILNMDLAHRGLL